jgi:signal transduction histidine kinase
MEFSQLPTIIASKVYQVLQTGAGIAPFKHHPPESPGAEWQVSIVPFQNQDASPPTAALLVVDDHTLVAQVQRLEIEAANLRLVKAMADRMAHEIGNALVPLATHQQLLAEKFRDAEFRASLDVAMADGVKRISRLTAQMRFLARDSLLTTGAIPLKQVVEEAFQEALKHQSAKSAKLKLDEGDQAVILNGDRAALRHALAEIVLNAIQANPAEARVTTRLSTETDAAGARWAHVEIQDTGTGFTPEAAEKATQAFFTTRTIGLGLGLTVARKIIEAHQGRLIIPAPAAGHFGLVKISLPLTSVQIGRAHV